MLNDNTSEFVTDAAELFCSPFKRRFTVVGPLPISGKRFRLQSLSEGELSSYQALAVGKDGFKPSRMEDANRRLIARCVVDNDGNRLITDAQAAKLVEWDSADTAYLYNECARHVGLKRDEIEDLVKNSDMTVGGGLLSG
jgi:hypothetical protein